jgi:UDP-glucose 4-epimerase
MVLGPVSGSWLVTGGAGYIGAHVTADLVAAGCQALVVDDLSTGSADRLPTGVGLIRADVRDTRTLRSAIIRHGICGIVHLAARKDVAESTADPVRYYAENIDGLRSVLDAAFASPVKHIVYSSSAAVYGTPATALVSEDAPTLPVNPYGRSKLTGEWMLADAAPCYGLSYVSLRYFNVAGAAAPELGDIGEANLLPRLLGAAVRGHPATVYGGDYSTRDGSGERDYVHVKDVSSAHLRAVEALTAGEVDAGTFNVGGGTGVTVIEMIDAVCRITGRFLDYRVAERRTGDPASVVASVDAIAERLGWRSGHDLDEIVASAWRACQFDDGQTGHGLPAAA